MARSVSAVEPAGPSDAALRFSPIASLHLFVSLLGEVEHATPDVNVATLSGHGSLRRRAGIDDGTRHPSDAQLERMQAILERDLRAGAFGMSTGLEYVPGRYAEMRELVSLGPVIARHDGVEMSHMRSEDADDVRASIRELMAAAGPARAPEPGPAPPSPGSLRRRGSSRRRRGR